MTWRRAATAAIGATFLLLISCARAPEKDLETARERLADLRDGRAARWAPVEAEAAEEAMAAAETEVALQEGRFFPLRSYGVAEELIAIAIEDMALADEAARRGEERAREEAEEALRIARSAVESARTAMMLAPVSRGRGDAYGRLDEELRSSASLLDEARRLIDESRHPEATATAERVLTMVSARVRDVHRTNGS